MISSIKRIVNWLSLASILSIAFPYTAIAAESNEFEDMWGICIDAEEKHYREIVEEACTYYRSRIDMAFEDTEFYTIDYENIVVEYIITDDKFEGESDLERILHAERDELVSSDYTISFEYPIFYVPVYAQVNSETRVCGDIYLYYDFTEERYNVITGQHHTESKAFQEKEIIHFIEDIFDRSKFTQMIDSRQLGEVEDAVLLRYDIAPTHYSDKIVLFRCGDTKYVWDYSNTAHSENNVEIYELSEYITQRNAYMDSRIESPNDAQYRLNPAYWWFGVVIAVMVASAITIVVYQFRRRSK